MKEEQIFECHRVNEEKSVRMYDFKLEGGEWFKKSFRKLFRIE